MHLDLPSSNITPHSLPRTAHLYISGEVQAGTRSPNVLGLARLCVNGRGSVFLIAG